MPENGRGKANDINLNLVSLKSHGQEGCRASVFFSTIFCLIGVWLQRLRNRRHLVVSEFRCPKNFHSLNRQRSLFPLFAFRTANFSRDFGLSLYTSSTGPLGQTYAQLRNILHASGLLQSVGLEPKVSFNWKVSPTEPVFLQISDDSYGFHQRDIDDKESIAFKLTERLSVRNASVIPV